MLLKIREDNHLVEVADLISLISPEHSHVEGSVHWGEEAGDPEPFAKNELAFPSGEPLPRCWKDSHYRDV